MFEKVVFALGIALYLVLCLLVARMAKSYRRSPEGWFFLALVFSPLVAWIFLEVADVPHSAVVRAEDQKAVRVRHPEEDDRDVKLIAAHEGMCPHCGAVINTYTGEGLRNAEDESWKLLCTKCDREIPQDVSS